MACNNDYKIGYTPAALVSLRLLGIAPPDQVTFQPASTYYSRSDFSRVGDGFIAVAWVFDIISIDRLANLLAYLDGDTWNDVYIRTDMRDGTIPMAENAFKVYSAIMWKPMLFGKEGNPVAKSARAMQTVNIQFMNLVEQIGYL